MTKTLEELYFASEKSRVKDGRTAADGGQAVNFMENTFQTEFTARPHGTVLTWLKNAENNENSTFTKSALEHYNSEYAAFGTVVKANFITNYIPSDRNTWYDMKFGTGRTGPQAGKATPGILFSNAGA